MKTIVLAWALTGIASHSASSSLPLPSLSPKTTFSAPAEGWGYFFGSCSWYCGAPKIKVSASSFLTEPSGLKHPPGQSHDGNMAQVWSEGVAGNGIGESLTFTFVTTEEDTTDLGVTSCAIAIGHQASEELFLQNARPKKIELRLDGKPATILSLKDSMGLQQFAIPKLELERPSKHSITLKIVEVYPGSKFEDTCISEVYFQGTGRMH